MTGLNCSDNPTGSLPKYRHVALLGTTVVVCLSLAEPVFADNFIITGDQTTTNGGEGPINGNDSVTLNGTITTTTVSPAPGYGISTTGGSNKISIETGGIEATRDEKPVGINNTGGSTETFVMKGTTITTNGYKGYGVFSSGGLNETIIDGTIETSGELSHAISVSGGENKTTVSGSIVTGDPNENTKTKNSYGIRNEGIGNETTVSAGGSIKTYGTSSHGIFNLGDGNETTVSGSISTQGKTAYGIYNMGKSNVTTIEAGGSIETTGIGAIGVFNEGRGNTTNVVGSITTAGDNKANVDDTSTQTDGIRNTGGNNTTNVSGTVTTRGNSARGIYNAGGSNTTTLSGSIITEGKNARGIVNNRANNETTITETGSIETADTGSTGIRQSYDAEALTENILTVEGSISTKGKNARGISNETNGNKTTVSGSISTQGETAYGIYNFGDSNTTTISAGTLDGSNITTSGTGAHGIYNLGDNNITILASGGSITTTGVNTGGIIHAGDNNTAGVFGTVNSSGTGSAALNNASGTGNTFVLNETAVIIGSISASNAASNNTLALSEHADFELTVGGSPNEGEVGQGTGPGQWTYQVSNGDRLRSARSSDGQKVEFVAVDVSNCAAGSTICYDVVYEEPASEEQHDDIHYIDKSNFIDSLSPGGSGGGGSSSSGGGSSASGGAGSDKSSGAGAKGNVQTRSNTVWANVYGIKTTGDETDSRAEMKSRTAGFTIGVPIRTNNDLEWDLVFNLSNSRNDLGSTGDQELKVQSYNFGAVFYNIAPSSGWDVDAFGFIGYNDYDHERDVHDNTEADGIDTRKYSYSGNEILLGFDAEYYKPFNETLDLKFDVNGFLSHEKTSSYSTGHYYKWDARNMTQGSIGVSTGVEHRKGALMAYADIGVDYVTLLSGKTADYSFNGQARSFTDSDTDDVYGKVDVGFEYNQSENVIIDGKLSGFSSTGGISGYAATLGIEVNF